MALVVGNDDYAGVSPLENAVNDARAVASALEDVGFAVERVENTTQEALETALAAFAGSLRGNDVALFYFAGHGMEVDSVNYLIPTDFDAQNAAGVRFDAVSALVVQEMLQGARVAMLVFDACRNNPYRGFRDAGGGLAPMEARGTLIAYAAGAGELAADAAPGADNGLFTSKFVEALGEPDLTASDLFRRVRREVFAASNEEQWPAVYDDLLADFVFRPSAGGGYVAPAAAGGGAGPTAGGGTAAAAPLREQETVFWESIRDSRDPADFRAYKRRFPGGVYEDLADNRLVALAAVAGGPAVTGAGGGGREEAGRAGEAALRLDSASRRRMQRALRTLGHDPGGADGVFGAGTRTAIRAWQASRGVAATGYLTAGDVAALNAAGGGPRPSAVDRRRAGDVFRDCGDCPQMVVVPAGTFTMGSPASEDGRFDNEGPLHRVSVDRFAVGMYEVTRGEYAAFVQATRREHGGGCFTLEVVSNDSGGVRGSWVNDARVSWRDQGQSHPVVCVTWHDARAYATWLSEVTGERYRLASEAEWEYAARAGTSTPFYWDGATAGRCRYSNSADRAFHQYMNQRDSRWGVPNDGCTDGSGYTSPVGSFSPNQFGLFDMSGNVYEWVEDCWHEDYGGAPTDGSSWTSGGDCSLRVLRGGSWHVSPRYLRSAYRYRNTAGYRNGYSGFRVSRTLD